MPRPTPHISLTFTPPFESALPIAKCRPPDNLLAAAREVYSGLRYVTVRRITNKDGKQQKRQIYRIDVKNAAYGQTPEFSPDIIASTCAAMASDDATTRSKSTTHLVTFWGCRPPGSKEAPHSFAQFTTAPRDEEAGDGDGEEADEEDEDEEGEEGEDEEEEEDEDEEEEEEAEEETAVQLVGEAGAGEPWNPLARPGDRHEAMAPRIEHVPPEQFAAAFPPGAMPPAPTPVQLGNMTTQTQVGMEHYASMMHPAQSLFLHHLGGVMAETRASMREMRLDVREARAEAKAATDRMVANSAMGSANFEAMHKSTQIGWEALHQGMTMQLNTLQNSMAWERRIMELQHGQQGGGTGMMVVQMLMAMIPQLIAGVAMFKGVPPEAAAMLGSMMGGAMPGGMPGGMQAMPGGMPGAPGGAPPMGYPPPPPGFAPPAAPPPPGFNGHGGPPMGFAPPSAPPPGFAPAAAPPPPGFNGQSGPPGGFVMPAAPPDPSSFVQFRPISPTPDSTAPPPASPMGSMGPGPFGVMPPSGPMGPGPFGVMHEMPPAPMGEVPTVDAMRARFQQAPLCAMIESLLVSTSRNGGQARLIQAGCGHLVHALENCRGAASDLEARPRFIELGRLLSTPGVTEAVAQQLTPGEERLTFVDVRNVMCGFVQPPPISFDTARAPSIAWPPSQPSAPPMPTPSPMPMAPPTPPPMRLVHDAVMPTMPMPSPVGVAPPPAVDASAPPAAEVYVDDDVDAVVDASVDAPAKMRAPVRGSKRRPKPAPGQAR